MSLKTNVPAPFTHEWEKIKQWASAQNVNNNATLLQGLHVQYFLQALEMQPVGNLVLNTIGSGVMMTELIPVQGIKDMPDNYPVYLFVEYGGRLRNIAQFTDQVEYNKPLHAVSEFICISPINVGQSGPMWEVLSAWTAKAWHAAGIKAGTIKPEPVKPTSTAPAPAPAKA